MKWQKSDIQELKQRCSILDVASRLGIEVQHNRARCIHPHNHANGDRTPSMSFSPEKSSFNCWVCPDVQGDVISLVQQHQNIGFVEALNYLAEMVGMRHLAQNTQRYTQKQNSRNAQAEFPQSDQRLQRSAGAENAPSNTESKIESELFTQPLKGSPEWIERRSQMVLHFLRACEPIDAQTMRYLNKRKIFKKTIEKQKLRWVKDYRKVSDLMKSEFEMEELQEYGFFNQNQHLRFFKHELILPYLETDGRPVYFQARSIDPETTPKELNLKGPILLPYNRPVLDMTPGIVYVCEGVIDTLTLLDKGFVAVGIPGVKAFREEWVKLFLNKKVYLAFDNDAPGREASQRVEGLFKTHGIFANHIELPDGMDINSWFQS